MGIYFRITWANNITRHIFIFVTALVKTLYRPMLVLAFDPGYGRTGWGVVESVKSINNIKPIAWGVIETRATMKHSARLNEIYVTSKKLIEKYKPDEVVIEKLYLSNNKKTVAGVYQAQGVLFAVCGQAGISPIELGPTQIKKGITGSGRANKNDVIYMVQQILDITEKITPDDAADALAGSIVGLQTSFMQKKILEKKLQKENRA